VKALIKNHLMKLLFLPEATFNIGGAEFEPDRVHLKDAVAVCTSAVCNILNELNVTAAFPLEGYHVDMAWAILEDKRIESLSPIDAAWAILTDSINHQDPNAFALHLNEMGLNNPTTLLGCSRSSLHIIAEMLKPAPRNVFMKAMKETWEVDRAWGILQNEKQVRNKEALAAILEDQGMEGAEYLGHATEEVLTQIVQCLKPAGASLFKQAMKLE
jgi:hypothetical protein